MLICKRQLVQILAYVSWVSKPSVC
jgi:hypothetical protein